MTGNMDDVRAEWWLSTFADFAELDHDQLVAAVLELATRVRAGTDSLVDELVAAARVLRYRYEERGTGYPMWKASTLRLSEMPICGLAAKTQDDPMVMTTNMVTSENAPEFVSTTAGFVRRTYTRGTTPVDQWLRSSCLATLPVDLPDDDDAPVVLYGTSMGGISDLLSAIGDGHDTTKAITHLLKRIVDHHPFPWEPGGWNGD